MSLALGPVLLIVVQRLFFPIPLGIYVDGFVLGILTSLVAVGLVLVYRANRVINFAQADLGYVPGVLTAMLVLANGFNIFLAFFTGLAAAALLGGAIEFFIIRRFFHSSRLILTVATLGVSSVLAFCGLLLPRWWDERVTAQRLSGPFEDDFRFDIAPRLFDGDHLTVVVLGIAAISAVGLLLRYTSLGIAMRASAERADRASLLGIPVRRLQGVVWAIAATLAFMGVFLNSLVIGLPFGGALSFAMLLRALAAMMFARMTNIPTAVAASIAVSILQQAVNWNSSNAAASTAVVAAVILVSLLVLRPGSTRAEQDQTSSWQATDEARAIPRELVRLPEVRAFRAAVVLASAVFAIWLPFWLGPGDTVKASAVLVFTLVILSLVVLTGWAGQVSLGQAGFMAVGAVVAARLTNEWNIDLLLALPVAGIAGMVIAVLVGIPALRLRGLYLAVTTLAFGTALTSYLLAPRFADDAPGWLQAVSFNWIPEGRVERTPILGRIEWTSTEANYYVTLAATLVMFLAVQGIRHSRTGRVLIAMRENSQAAQSYGVSATRAKLMAFAISGFIAGYSGGLWVHAEQGFGAEAYGPGLSIGIFVAAVVGGVGSVLGAFLGGLYWTGSFLFLRDGWTLLSTGAGVLLILLMLPSGLAGGLQRLRDMALRSLAERKGIVVPSLVADVLVEDTDDEPDTLVISAASNGSAGSAGSSGASGVGSTNGSSSTRAESEETGVGQAAGASAAVGDAGTPPEVTR